MTQNIKNRRSKLVLALPEADSTLTEAQILRTWSMVPDAGRKIE